jgi:hypothetical protein
MEKSPSGEASAGDLCSPADPSRSAKEATLFRNLAQVYSRRLIASACAALRLSGAAEAAC